MAYSETFGAFDLEAARAAVGSFCFAGAQHLGAADDWSVYVVKTNNMGAIRSLP